MTQVDPDALSDQEREDQLWTAYVVALARHQENWRLQQQAWHDYVHSGLADGVSRQVWDRARELCQQSRQHVNEADSAWMRVAYPLHNIPLRDEDK